MSVHNFAPVHPAPKAFRLLAAAAALATFLLMVGGSAVRASGSAMACPDWPTCFGQIGVPANMEAQIQVAHRALAVIAGLLVWLAAGWALLQRNRQSWLVRIALSAAAGLMLVESLVGGLGVLKPDAIWPDPLHLSLAMLVFGLVLVAAVTVYVKQAEVNPGLRLKFQSPFARLSLWTLAGIFTLMLSGALVSALDAGAQCAGWPLCAGGLPQARPWGGWRWDTAR